jgi:hypothetical protein
MSNYLFHLMCNAQGTGRTSIEFSLFRHYTKHFESSSKSSTESENVNFNLNLKYRVFNKEYIYPYKEHNIKMVYFHKINRFNSTFNHSCKPTQNNIISRNN